jgi:hypothetical protein
VQLDKARWGKLMGLIHAAIAAGVAWADLPGTFSKKAWVEGLGNVVLREDLHRWTLEVGGLEVSEAFDGDSWKTSEVSDLAHAIYWRPGGPGDLERRERERRERERKAKEEDLLALLG